MKKQTKNPSGPVDPGPNAPINEHAKALPSLEQFQPSKARKKMEVRTIEAGTITDFQGQINYSLQSIFDSVERPDIFSIETFQLQNGNLFAIISYYTTFVTMPTMAPTS